MKINSYTQFKSENTIKIKKIKKLPKKWPFLATFGKIAKSQSKSNQIKKNRSRQNQRLSYKIRPRNRISKDLMEICGDGNSTCYIILYLASYGEAPEFNAQQIKIESYSRNQPYGISFPAFGSILYPLNSRVSLE